MGRPGVGGGVSLTAVFNLYVGSEWNVLCDMNWDVLCFKFIWLFCRFRVEGEQKYTAGINDLGRPERNTLTVSFEDVDKFNQNLATTIVEEYYRYF